MAVTIDKFELLPGAAPADGGGASTAGGAAAGDASGAPPQPSRHDILKAVRLEQARHARVRAH